MVTFARKREYIEWYRLAQETVSDDDIIQVLSADGITNFVNETDWLIIPNKGELKKEQAKNRDNGNIWISLGPAFETFSDESKIRLGISFNNGASRQRLINLLSTANSKTRKSLVEKFSQLDDRFQTTLYKKIKTHNWAESPKYDPVLKFQTNKVSDKDIGLILETAQKIEAEASQKLKEAKEEGKHYSDFPDISIIEIKIDRHREEFVKKVHDIKEVYEICAQIRSNSLIKKELTREIKDLESRLPVGEESLEEGNIQKSKEIMEQITKKKQELELLDNPV